MSAEAVVAPRDLRDLALFAGLSDEQVAELAAAGNSVPIEPGVVLFTEGHPAERWWVLLDGAIELVRRIGREDMVVARMDVLPSARFPYTTTTLFPMRKAAWLRHTVSVPPVTSVLVMLPWFTSP